MRFVRSVLSGICFFIFGLGGFIIGSAVFPIIVLFSSKKRRFILAKVIMVSWKIFVKLMIGFRLIKVDVKNIERLKSCKGKVVIANHPSLIDVVLLVSIIPNAICVVKSSLLHNIWVSGIIKMVYIANNKDVSSFISEAGNLLHQGFNIIIFPEGTRTKPDDVEHHLYRGFAQLALYAKVPILPIVIRNNPSILGKGQGWYNVGDRVSVYTITVCDDINIPLQKVENFHKTSKEIVSIVKSIFFS